VFACTICGWGWWKLVGEAVGADGCCWGKYWGAGGKLSAMVMWAVFSSLYGGGGEWWLSEFIACKFTITIKINWMPRQNKHRLLVFVEKARWANRKLEGVGQSKQSNLWSRRTDQATAYSSHSWRNTNVWWFRRLMSDLDARVGLTTKTKARCFFKFECSVRIFTCSNNYCSAPICLWFVESLNFTVLKMIMTVKFAISLLVFVGHWKLCVGYFGIGVVTLVDLLGKRSLNIVQSVLNLRKFFICLL
jgi:hypothetical protein